MPPRARRVALLRLAASVGGFGLVAAGLAGYDWRVAAIAAGVILLAGAILDARTREQNP